MTTGRLCQPFHSTSNQSYAASVLESPSIDDGDELDESLIPAWDDADDIIPKIFDDEDAHSSRHEDESDGWTNDEGDDRSSSDEKKGNTTTEPLAPWLRNTTSSLRNRIPIISSDDSDDDEEQESDDDNDVFSGEGEDSNEENRQHLHSKLWRSKSDSLCRFSLPKYLVEKSKESAVAAASLKATKTDISKAVLSQTPGEVLIRAHLLQRHHLPEVLDVVRCFSYPTRRLVIEEVHQGADVEALLIYLFEATHANGTDALRSVRYTGSWISPTLISYLASSESRVEEIELGLSLYPKARSSGRRSARRAPVRNVARHLQRAEELEEALAANTSLRVLRLLPASHVKITEGLLWAASCHGGLESIVVTLPARTPISTADVHESGILAFEGVAEVIRKSANLRDLSIRVDPKLCRPHKDTHEPVEAKKEWGELSKALRATNSLTNLRIEFDHAIGETSPEILNDMGTGLMQGFAKNSSLKVLELVNTPSDAAMDLLYGVHTREKLLQKVILRQCPEIVSSLTCIEDDEDRQKGWWTVPSLHVDQASLAHDLFGLEILANAGGLRELVVLDSMSKRNAERLTQALCRDSKVDSLVMGHDNPRLLSSLESNALQSLELRGGRHPVSTEMASLLLDACPDLRRLQLTDVQVDGDWSAVWQRMDTHRLESLEINERGG
mmetsp:Transcript_25991/g.49303  ORF Transcript_25991/g.49303 Transcript_25991/m.49303 type:complete len:672 (+) Transcript_25991:79-2094(+)|eukprot:scaffold7349_cov173-Amphora_coffeaeformis.AAC.131